MQEEVMAKAAKKPATAETAKADPRVEVAHVIRVETLRIENAVNAGSLDVATVNDAVRILRELADKLDPPPA
jgi:hypothetical protein